MTKPNASYETIMVISTKNGEEATTELVEKFKGLIEQNGTIASAVLPTRSRMRWRGTTCW